MAISRYSNTEILDGNHYGTFDVPTRARGMKEINLLEGIRTIDYVVQVGDRPDILAAKYFNDESYGWVLLLVNGIYYPFGPEGLFPGRTIRIPLNVRDVLDKLFR